MAVASGFRTKTVGRSSARGVAMAVEQSYRERCAPLS
jgi:hypothetical protein